MKIFFLFLFSLSALAQDCQEMNLITQKDSPFNKIPVYDQNGTGLCYAYSAAQMLDYHLIKKGESKRKIHPLWLGLMYSIAAGYKPDNKVSGGDSYFSLRYLISGTTCDYETVTETLKTWSTKVGVPETELLAMVEMFFDEMELMKSEAGVRFWEPLSEKQISKAYKKAAKKQERLSCAEEPKWEELFTEIKALIDLNPIQIFSDMLLSACKATPQVNSQLPVPVDTKLYNMSDERVASEVSELLTRNLAPVSISYCANTWRFPIYDGVGTRGSSVDVPEYSEDCEMHESLVVGQKSVKGSCQYLVRNSWGSGWGTWNESRKCLCRHKETGEYKDDCTKFWHDNGKYTVEACWLPSKNLGKNTFGITTLAPDKGKITPISL